MKEKATLILGGGSALGLAHIGVLSILEEEFEITGIIGSSMGSIIGGLYSSGLSSAKIYEPVSYTHLRAHETVLDLV